MKKILLAFVLLMPGLALARMRLETKVEITRGNSYFIVDKTIILENETTTRYVTDGYTQDKPIKVAVAVEKQNNQEAVIFFELFDKEGSLIWAPVLRAEFGKVATVKIGTVSSINEDENEEIAIQVTVYDEAQ